MIRAVPCYHVSEKRELELGLGGLHPACSVCRDAGERSRGATFSQTSIQDLLGHHT